MLLYTTGHFSAGVFRLRNPKAEAAAAKRRRKSLTQKQGSSAESHLAAMATEGKAPNLLGSAKAGETMASFLGPAEDLASAAAVAAFAAEAEEILGDEDESSEAGKDEENSEEGNSAEETDAPEGGYWELVYFTKFLSRFLMMDGEAILSVLDKPYKWDKEYEIYKKFQKDMVLKSFLF